MAKVMRVAAAAGLCGGVVAAMLALSAEAGAAAGSPAGGPGWSTHGTHVVTPSFIDTNRVVGSPQDARVPTWEGPGSQAAAGRGGPVAPAITLEPSSQTVAPGGTATFTASASGSPTPSVQWYRSTNGGGRWAAIGGATADTYAFAASASESGDEFEAIFRNNAGSATTTPATLLVSSAPTAPTITTQPKAVTVASGAEATFSAAASGYPTPTVQWYESTNGGGSFTAVSGATADSYSFTAAADETGDEFYALFKNSAGSATTVTVTLTVTAAVVQSSNWSGYAAQGADGAFSAVTGSWKVPTVTCSGRSSSYSAQWIGIDGYSSDTVEQTGTEADCIGGSPSYDAWYEMYGDSAVNDGDEVELSAATNPISPGDEMTATVSESAGTWTLTIADTSQGWTSPITVVFAGAEQSSAEWIVERPELCSVFSCSLASLADFGTVTFTDAEATSATANAPISAYTNTDLEMVNGTTALAVPGPLTLSGTGFTDTWES